MPERITGQLMKLLEALTSDPEREWYGLELMDATQMKSGTLYPLLHRLVVDGWLERTHDVPSDIGGTSRRMYRLTGHGVRSADELLAKRSRVINQRRRSFRPGVVPA